MRILKFDILYPNDYFLQKQEENKTLIGKLSFEEYVQWIHSLKIGYGDIITKELKKAGWEIQDYYNQDPVFIQKLKESHHFNTDFIRNLFSKNIKYLKPFTLKTILQYRRVKNVRQEVQKNILLRKFIDAYKPDIIFLREPCQVDNAIFREIKDQYLVATLIGCNISHPINWQAQNSDTIFTIFPEYKTFFDANRINSSLFEYGIDDTVYEEVKDLPKIHDVVFVGLLGTEEQSTKTQLMEYVAGRFDFKWWGPKGNLIEKFPNLQRTWQGVVAGKEMFIVYRQAKIVVNDYVDTANNSAVNMRIKEVLSTGSLLLTRTAENISFLKELGAIEVFTDEEDCAAKISHLLKAGDEREQIAKKGYATAKKLYSSAVIIKNMKDVLEENYVKKFNVKRH